MSRELVVGHVMLGVTDWERAANLVAHRERAGRAIESAPIGDRTALVKYAQLTSELEKLAYAAWSAGAPISDEPTERSIRLEWPFATGLTPQSMRARTSTGPRAMWRATDPRASRTAATYERFVEQLERWSAPDPSPETPPLCPSGVQNRALTEALRRFAGTTPASLPRSAPVVYVDGSAARPFPLHTADLTDAELSAGRELRFTLLSVRHFSMDPIVDGAWLRNREISLPRARAETDELAYLRSRDQLARLGTEPLTLHLYQTGLEMAVFGFYRALIDHMRVSTSPLSLVPHYFAGVVEGEDRFERGTRWTSRRV